MRVKERTNKGMRWRAALWMAASCSLFAVSAHAGMITVGGGGNGSLGDQDADTAASVVVIANQQVVTDTGETYDLAASTFNLVDKSTDQTVTPFIALFTGGDTQDLANYDVVAVGDVYTSTNAGIGLSVAFQAAAGTLTTSAGDIVVGGMFNDNSGVVGWTNANGNPGDLRIILQGTVDVATDLTQTGNNWSTNAAVNNRTYFFDIGLTPVPEPSTCLLLGLGLLSFVACVRRRR